MLFLPIFKKKLPIFFKITTTKTIIILNTY